MTRHNLILNWGKLDKSKFEGNSAKQILQNTAHSLCKSEGHKSQQNTEELFQIEVKETEN